LSKAKDELKQIQRALLTGVSYMMPFVVVGGLLLAISLSTGKSTSEGFVVSNQFMQNLKTLGNSAFTMMIPVLGGYIAYSIAGRPGLVPGMVLGYLANNPIGEIGAKSGFLGAMLLAIASGYLVKWIKTWKVHKAIKAIMPILIIPIVSTLSLGLIYIYFISVPLASMTNALVEFLGNLNGTNTILLAICIGFMNAFDMGGPVTKTVSMFTLALMNEGIYEPNGMFRITVAIPPIGIFLSTILFRNKWTDADRTAAASAGLMGCMGITEGAIPFVVADIKRVLPCTMIGAAVGAIIGGLSGVTSPVPHGGFITLPVVHNKPMFALGIIGGSLVTALLLGLVKKPLGQPKNVE